jgi:hypothetical protein
MRINTLTTKFAKVVVPIMIGGSLLAVTTAHAAPNIGKWKPTTPPPVVGIACQPLNNGTFLWTYTNGTFQINTLDCFA